MGSKIGWLLTVITITLFGLVGWSTRGQGASKPVWEYQVARILVTQEQERLNELGAQGWELVAVGEGTAVETHKDGRDYYYKGYYLKRAR